jgi:hypothetical protein
MDDYKQGSKHEFVSVQTVVVRPEEYVDINGDQRMDF